jgi:hypothetical protein
VKKLFILLGLVLMSIGLSAQVTYTSTQDTTKSTGNTVYQYFGTSTNIKVISLDYKYGIAVNLTPKGACADDTLYLTLQGRHGTTGLWFDIGSTATVGVANAAGAKAYVFSGTSTPWLNLRVKVLGKTASDTTLIKTNWILRQ